MLDRLSEITNLQRGILRNNANNDYIFIHNYVGCEAKFEHGSPVETLFMLSKIKGMSNMVKLCVI